MTGKIKTAIEPIESLQTEWTDLLSRSRQNNLFLTWEWMNSWNTHMLRETETTLIITAREENRLIGIAPLVRQHHRFLGDRYMLLGQLYSYHLGFIGDKEMEADVCSALCKHLFLTIGRKLFVIDFKNLDVNVLKSVLLSEANVRGFNFSECIDNPCKVLDLPSTFDDYLNNGITSTKLKTNIKNDIKRLSDQYDFRCYKAGIAEIESMWLKLLVFHRSQMRLLKRHSVLLEDSFPEHLKEVIDILRIKESVKLTVMKVNDDSATVLLGIIHNGVFNAITIGINSEILEKLPWASLNVLAHTFAIKQAIEDGCKEFDFLGGEHDFKSKMGGREKGGLKIEIYRSGFQKYFVNAVSNVADNIKHNFVKRQKSFPE